MSAPTPPVLMLHTRPSTVLAIGTALMCLGLGSAWFLLNSDTKDASGVAEGEGPRMPSSPLQGQDLEETERDTIHSQREASLVSVGDEVPVQVRPQNAEALEDFGRTFHISLGASQLTDPAFAKGEHSHLGTLCIFIRNNGLTAKDLRSLFDSLPEDDPLRTWAALGVAYGKGMSQEDLTWLEGLATKESRSVGTSQLAAILGLRVSARVDGIDSNSALSRVTQTFLQRASDSEPGESFAGVETQIRLALHALEELGPALPATSLAEFGMDPRTSSSTSEACFKTLASAGGMEGGLMVIDAVMAGNENARSAIASLRDPAATPTLIGWVKTEAQAGGDFQLASAAVSGLLSTDETLGLKTVDELLRAGGIGSEAAIAGLKEFGDPRSRGTALRLWHMQESLEMEPEYESTANQVLEALMGGRGVIRPWLLPGFKARQETCQGLRRAIGALPSDSQLYASAFWDLIRLSPKQDLDFMELEIDSSSPHATQISGFIQDRRNAIARNEGK